jgi:hypothetical protein
MNSKAGTKLFLGSKTLIDYKHIPCSPEATVKKKHLLKDWKMKRYLLHMKARGL